MGSPLGPLPTVDSSSSATVLSLPLPVPQPKSQPQCVLPARRVSSVTAARASVGFGAVGEQTAALSVRWLQMMDEQQQQPQPQSQARPQPPQHDGSPRARDEEAGYTGYDELQTERRISSASSVAVGDCTADIAAMLEAVLVDGQSTEAAMQLYYQNTNDRMAQQRRGQAPIARTGHDEDDDCETEQEWADHTANPSPPPCSDCSQPQCTPAKVHEPAVLPAQPSPLAQLPLLAAYCPDATDAGTHTATDTDTDSGAAPTCPALDSATAATGAECSVAGLPSFLDSAFQLLGVSSMDDSNLHAKLRKRDSSFQPHSTAAGSGSGSEADYEHRSAEASGSNEPMLQSAIERTLLAGEELDELQSACLQLMDVNAQLRDECGLRHSQLTLAHTTLTSVPVAAAERSTSLHRFLADVAQSSSSGVTRPVASTALCRAVSSHYNLCVQLARLSWLHWHTALSGANAGRSDSSGRQVEADGEMASEVATMQTTMQQIQQAALNNRRVEDSRLAAIAAHKRCVEAALQLAALADLTASQQRLEEAMAVSLRQYAIAVQDAALSVEQQRKDQQTQKLSRSTLFAIAEVGQCQLASATPSHIDIVLQPAPYVTLRYARINSAEQQSAVAVTHGDCYQITRLCVAQQTDSFRLHAPLLQALCSAVDVYLSLEGAHVPLSAVPMLLRRCAGLLHRAMQWQQSIDTVSKLHGSRLIVSVCASHTASEEFVVSLRHQSPSRRHQLVCKLSVTLAVEPRSAISVVMHEMKMVSLAPSVELVSVNQKFSNWMKCDRVDGYAQLERISGKMSELLAAL